MCILLVSINNVSCSIYAIPATIYYYDTQACSHVCNLTYVHASMHTYTHVCTLSYKHTPPDT